MQHHQPSIRRQTPLHHPSSPPENNEQLIKPEYWRQCTEHNGSLRECERDGVFGDTLVALGAPIKKPCGFLVLEGELIELADVVFEGRKSKETFVISRKSGDVAGLFSLLGVCGFPMPYAIAVPRGSTARYAVITWNMIVHELRFGSEKLRAIEAQRAIRSAVLEAYHNKHLVDLMQQHIDALEARVDALTSENARLLQSDGGSELPQPQPDRRISPTIVGVAPPAHGSAPRPPKKKKDQ